MRISVFGLGYVGAVCAACLSDAGHQVTAVDVSTIKVDLTNGGRAPVVEPGLEEIIARQVKTGNLRATTNTADAVNCTELTLICIATPSRKNGSLDLRPIQIVCSEIAEVLRDKHGYHSVAIRSTVPPGTIRDHIIPILERISGRRAGIDFGVAVNPEFLRESSAISDYLEPPMTVIGELDERSGALLAALYSPLPTLLIRRSIELAEMVKYTCNAWHATKITFANEIGNIAKAAGVDGREVMDIVCADTKLNISTYCMKPGFAFGGSCLPKDLRALLHRAAELEVEMPLIGSLLKSNQAQIDRAVAMVAAFGKKRVSLLGLSFKPATDDLRESPLVALAETLIGKGYELAIFDRNVNDARTHGATCDYINLHIPRVSCLLSTDLEAVIEHGEVVVVGNRDQAFKKALTRVNGSRPTLDLVGFMHGMSYGHTQGICW